MAALKSQGYIPTFYVNKAEAALGSVMGHAHGADWATMYPEGHYFWPYYDWQMCMDHEPWRAYLARTCARIIEETGGDGVRIDEMGGASRSCQNKKHPHTFARWRHYNELQAQSDAARRVHGVIFEVDDADLEALDALKLGDHGIHFALDPPLRNVRQTVQSVWETAHAVADPGVRIGHIGRAVNQGPLDTDVVHLGNQALRRVGEVDRPRGQGLFDVPLSGDRPFD